MWQRAADIRLHETKQGIPDDLPQVILFVIFQLNEHRKKKDEEVEKRRSGAHPKNGEGGHCVVLPKDSSGDPIGDEDVDRIVGAGDHQTEHSDRRCRPDGRVQKAPIGRGICKSGIERSREGGGERTLPNEQTGGNEDDRVPGVDQIAAKRHPVVAVHHQPDRTQNPQRPTENAREGPIFALQEQEMNENRQKNPPPTSENKRRPDPLWAVGSRAS